MRLSQMEDIGGCRAVLDSLDEVYAVAGRIRRRWPHARVTDHIEEPKADGYRSLHIVERRDGRLIEVQPRTTLQHTWAEAIEIVGPRLGFDLKAGEGPADLREYFRLAAERLARNDAGLLEDPGLERDFTRVREAVRQTYFP
jgi:putative GTP pyrophosphokinase